MKTINKLHKYGSWACVIGAAEGLGAAFCRELASIGFHLIVLDQKKEALETLLQDLNECFAIEVISCVADLEDESTVVEVMKLIEEKGCRFLIYNATYGPVKPFLANNEEELDRYIKVNIKSMVHLVHPFIAMNQQQASGILLLSSLAGFRGTSYVIPYGASKAYIWHFAEGLYYEFANTPLDISVCCPGPVDTPNYQSTHPQKTWLTPKAMSPQLVAHQAIKQFGKTLFIIPGSSNKISFWILQNLLPRKWASTIHNYAMKIIFPIKSD